MVKSLLTLRVFKRSSCERRSSSYGQEGRSGSDVLCETHVERTKDYWKERKTRLLDRRVDRELERSWSEIAVQDAE